MLSHFIFLTISWGGGDFRSFLGAINFNSLKDGKRSKMAENLSVSG